MIAVRIIETEPGTAGAAAERWRPLPVAAGNAPLKADISHVLIVSSDDKPRPEALDTLRAAALTHPEAPCVRFPEPDEDPAFPAAARRLFGVPLRVNPNAPLLLSRRFYDALPSRARAVSRGGSQGALWRAVERAGGGVFHGTPLVHPEPHAPAPQSAQRHVRLLRAYVRERQLGVIVEGQGQTLSVRAEHPRGFDLELTNRCNARCTFCPRTLCPETGDMDDATFERVLSLLRDQPVGNIYFIGRGEPMVHPKFLDYIRRIRARSGIHFEVFTNGLALQPRLVDALAELNDPDLDIAINVSLHSLQQETHKRLTGSDLERIAKNLRYLQGRADRLRVSYAFVTNKWNEDEMAKLRRHLDRTGNTAWDISLVYNKGGFIEEGPLFDEAFYRRQKNWDENDARGGTGPCWYSYSGAYYWVNFRGEFTLCHDDFLDETILGRVGESSLEEIDAKVQDILAGGGADRCGRCNKRLPELHHGENIDAAAGLKERVRVRLGGVLP